MILKAQRECRHEWILYLCRQYYVYCALCNAQFPPENQTLPYKGTIPAAYR